MSMLKISYMGRVRKSMSVNKYVCKTNTRLAIKDHTPRWLNRISGALALIPIESTPRGGE